MYYTVYKITNQVSGKIYVGVHKTSDLNDSYMGSGLRITNAIRKHGVENFKKEYIAIFDNPDDMFEMESELVNEEFVKSPASYNIKEGGYGGWDAANKALRDLKSDPVSAALYSSKLSRSIRDTHRLGKIKYNTFSGKAHSAETKAKIGLSVSAKCQGKANSQFGSMWITDRVSNKKISKGDPIPDGWAKGRTSPLCCH